jgi:LmbE family N-acetylglucosaminyl deacetylase
MLASNLKRLKVQRFKTIFVPSFQEFHPDHRAVTLGTLSFLQLEDWSGEVWLYEISRQGEVNRLVVIDQVRTRKSQAIACYQSQLAQAPYQELAQALDWLRAYSLSPQGVRHAEGFFAAPINILLKKWGLRIMTYFS